MHFVECGVELTNTYGDIDENFYTSVENTYANALELIDNNGLLEKCKERALKIVNDTDNIGWGFHDCPVDVYYEYYK